MKSRRILSFLLAFILALTLLPALTAPAKALVDVHITDTNGNCTWDLNSDALLCDGTRGMKLTIWPTDGTGPASLPYRLSNSFQSFVPLIQEVEIKEGVTSLPDGFLSRTGPSDGQGYYGLRDLRFLRLPDSLTTIGHSAFQSNFLYYLSFPPNFKNVEWSGLSAFDGMCVDDVLAFPNLTEGGFAGLSAKRLVLPKVSDFWGYDNQAFNQCGADVDLSRTSITTLDEHLFMGYYGKNLCLPATLKKVEAEAFWGASGPPVVHFAGTQTQWANVSISSDDNDSIRSARVYCDSTGTLAGRVTIPSNCVRGQVLTASVFVVGTEIERNAALPKGNEPRKREPGRNSTQHRRRSRRKNGLSGTATRWATLQDGRIGQDGTQELGKERKIERRKI